MNYSVVRYVLGWVMIIESAFMLMCCGVGLIYGEKESFAFLWTLIGATALGTLMVFRKPKNMTFYVKEGFVSVALSWIVLSAIGALPFVIGGDIPSYTDALFETVSGFTTTGSSVVADVEAMSRCCLFWRCFTNWIGGMGVLVFLLAVIPMTGGTQMNLMKAESPGPSVGKLVPKVKQTAIILYGIYIALTIIEVILLMVGGMSLYDALTTSFSTAGTGGFGIYNDSFVRVSPYIQWVVGIFLVMFGLNFGVYFLLLMRRFKQAINHEEMRIYFIVIAAATAIIVIDMMDYFDSIGETIRHAFFQVASIMTTAGFASDNFDLWASTSKTVLVLLMFIGACAGSTGGGIKISRLTILVKTVFKEVTSYLHPRSVKKIKVEGKALEHETLRAANVYMITYMLIFVASLLLISLEGKGLVTTFTSVATTLNNVGPGLEMVGPMSNFAHFTVFSKYVFIFDMLVGRLELFPMLLLFCPSIWKPKKNNKLEA